MLFMLPIAMLKLIGMLAALLVTPCLKRGARKGPISLV